MIAQLPFTADLIQAFGWALLHSFWQAFFIFACLRIVLLLWPQASSSIKYNLSYISLAGIFTWFSVTLYLQVEAVRRVHQAAYLMIETGIRPSAAVTVPAIYKSQAELTDLLPGLEMWFPVLVAIYVAGVAVMTIKLTVDLLQLQQIKKKQVLPIDDAWEKHLQKLAAQLKIPRRVKLLISQYIQVPVMIGFLKPVILLPVAMFNNLTAEQLEAILLHELAHIKRNDYLLNIFQSIVETILFFNPFVWWISKNIRLEREHCCDDLVLTNQVQPLHYAKALVALEEYRLTVNAMAMAAADNKQHLFHRIKRIMEMKTKNINYTQKLLAVMIIAVGLVSIAWLNPSNKDEQRENKKPAVKEEVADAPIAPAIAAPVVTHALRMAQYFLDTVPGNDKRRAEKEAAEKAAKEGLDAAQEAMKNIDWNQINSEVSNAMKNVDWKKINEEVSTAMKNVDWKKVNEEVSTALKNVDWKKINDEVKTSLKNMPDTLVDPKMIEESIRIGMESAKAAMANINIDDIIKKSMAEARGAMDSKEYKEAMENARKEIEKAKQEIKEAQKNVRKEITASDKHVIVDKKISDKYKNMVKRMAEDKLIDVEEGFTIEKKDGILTINGVQQSNDVLKKYADALGKADEATITGKGDNLSVSVNEK
ncbi:M56 family metallopeptidase [Chitinophaga filiformis]|uniref:Signal transducer regulating beta-lactamase production, contains metallopeptidase domain n=1 Tax=Chitinophaga filiformis TaxID=104663 RepID=A0A1G8A2A3_CHIFI|nr:M56 family metallopeptidase [Chitinophaga filiformis]SDH15072.1 Signal transducer regulating beta-lactamase production, contains metallopeptidase domain [Chitinophaga filiformis]